MRIGFLFRMLALAVLVAFLVRPEWFTGFFALFAGPRQPAIYNQGSLLDITLNHLMIVGAATLAANRCGSPVSTPDQIRSSGKRSRHSSSSAK